MLSGATDHSAFLQLRQSGRMRQAAYALYLSTVTCVVPVLSTQAIAQPEGRVPKRQLTVDDLMHAEELTENVSFSPDGNFVLFWRSQPLGQQSLRGLVNTNLESERMFVTDRDGVQPREITPSKGTTYSRFGGYPWAPDSSGALLYAISAGAYKIAYWSAQTGAVKVLPGRPPWTWVPFTWMGNRLIYATADEDRQQRDSGLQLVRSLQKKWRASWDGPAAQVTVSSANSLFEESRPEVGRLVVADVRSGAVATISHGNYVTLVSSPNGRWLAAVRLAEDAPGVRHSLSRRGRGELQLFEVRREGIRLVRTFGELDLEGESNNLTGSPGIAWSRDGHQLLIGGRAANDARHAACLYEIDAKSGTTREIVDDGVTFLDPRLASGGRFFGFGWIGDTPAVIAGRKERSASTEPPISGATGRDYGELQATKVDLYILREGRLQNLTAFTTGSIDRFIADPNHDAAMVIADGGLWQVHRGSTPRRLSPEDLGRVLDFAVDSSDPPRPATSAHFSSGPADRIALLVATPSEMMPSRIVLDLRLRQGVPAGKAGRSVVASSPDLLTTVSRELSGWSARYVIGDHGRDSILATANSEMKDIAVAPVKRFDYRSDGRNLTGWMITPNETNHRHPLPAIVSVYGGRIYGAEPPPTTSIEPPVFSGQLLASEGYAVIYPSLPLESGRDTDIMAMMADEVIQAVDALAAKGEVDPQRIGIMGQSFGGYCVAAILAKRSDRFKAGVALAGIYDYVYSYGNKSLADMLTDDGRLYLQTMTAPETAYVRFGEPFWTNLDAYVRNSPIFHVNDLNTPLLMLHGDLDVAQTGLPGAERMYHALVRAGKSPVLVRYWGEGHVAHSEPDMRDQWLRVTKWFGEYLK